MAVILQSPHPFAERFLFFGGAGSGKTNTALNIIEHCAEGEMYVCESDFSAAYTRALATDFTDVADRVHVESPDSEWESYTATLARVMAAGDPLVDWKTVDSISPTWEMVQDWFLTTQYGKDLPTMMRELQKEHQGDAKAFGKARSELMSWPIIKQEYAKRVYSPIQRWKGNLIITAEAKSVSKMDSDEIQIEFGPLGMKPSGEGRLMYVASSNLFLTHPKRGVWNVTTTKDRNREELDKMPVDDFAIDYLSDIAGWDVVRKAKAS